MSEQPREFDTEYAASIDHRIRRRVGLDIARGSVSRFVVQLEYFHDGGWHPVVRYDHDGTPDSEFGHDVRNEGLHIDIFRNGRKEATEYISPPLEAGPALDFVEAHLSKNLQRSSTGTNDGTRSGTDN